MKTKYVVREITKDTALQMIRKYHYSDTLPKINRYFLGFYLGGGVENTLAQRSFVKISDKRNKRDVWTVATQAVKEAHFATFPEKLIEPCILAGCPEDGIVLDPFCGSGTTGIVSVRNGRRFIGLELNPEYAEMSIRRIAKEEEQGMQIAFA